MTDQRKSYAQDRSGIGELDQLYKNANEINFPKDTRIQKDYTATVDDRRISFLQPGLTLTLPSLNDSADQFLLFVIDKSLEAGTTAQTILPNTGKTIGGATSLSISTNGGFYWLQWDAPLDEWFRVG